MKNSPYAELSLTLKHWLTGLYEKTHNLSTKQLQQLIVRAFIILTASHHLSAPLAAETYKESVIYVYDGAGVSQESLTQTLVTLKRHTHKTYKIKTLSPEEVRQGRWRQDAALFVMPGGADIPYCKDLNGAGNEHIRAFVDQGGRYLGICAGAYYGCAAIEFSKGTDIEVIGARELNFYPGLGIGPTYGPYDYKTTKSAKVLEIMWEAPPLTQKNSAKPQSPHPLQKKFAAVFYNGGGYFEKEDTVAVDPVKSNMTKKTVPFVNNVTVLARYPDPQNHAAIIYRQVGKGHVVLSGVHFEYEAPHLDASDSHYQTNIIPALQLDQKGREDLTRFILEALHMNLKS